jgi:hypothetical protein
MEGILHRRFASSAGDGREGRRRREIEREHS